MLCDRRGWCGAHIRPARRSGVPRGYTEDVLRYAGFGGVWERARWELGGIVLREAWRGGWACFAGLCGEHVADGGLADRLATHEFKDVSGVEGFVLDERLGDGLDLVPVFV